LDVSLKTRPKNDFSQEDVSPNGRFPKCRSFDLLKPRFDSSVPTLPPSLIFLTNWVAAAAKQRDRKDRVLENGKVLPLPAPFLFATNR
jgi:hypothetical protein